MARRRKGRALKKLGLKPGSVVYVGEQRDHDVSIDIIDYTDVKLNQVKVSRVEDAFPYRDSKTTTWININGIHNTEIVEKLGAHFHLHALLLEDLVNAGHRPKLEENPDNLFIVLKMLQYDEGNHTIVKEQISIVFNKNIVISFQEKEGDVFGDVRNRLHRTNPRIRFLNSDYLAYALIDAIVDHYFVVLEHIGERVEDLEDRLMDDPRPEHLTTIRNLKREMLSMRRAVWPLREILAALERSETKLIHHETRPYLRDLYEHVIQVIDNVETYRETVSSLQDIYLSSVSNKMNEVMKVLTIIATIFIPLGFLAGVYGMNFDTETSPLNMPELGSPYGYLGFWGMVLLVAMGLVWFFRRKKWL